MRIARVFSCAALSLLVAAAVPADGNAQIGRLIRRAAKQKVTEAVIDKAASVAGVHPDSASAAKAATAGLTFTDRMLEMTPDVLDRLEKGLAAEAAVRQEVRSLIGRVLPPDEYDRCRADVITGPEGQRVYTEAGNLMQGLTSQEEVLKASRELARRLDAIVVPRCGLDRVAAQQIREQHADRLKTAAPQASGLADHQLYTLVERLVPLCRAIGTIVAGTDGARVPTEVSSVFWVYSRSEFEAAQTRCEKLMLALNDRNEFALGR